MINNQQFYGNSCPRCKSQLNSQLQEKQSGSFRTHCTQCDFEKFVCYCPKCNKSIETTNLHDFGDGLRIKCTAANCKNQFQIVRCPHPSCHKFNCFNGNYQMGSLVRCQSCKTAFQELTCPYCLEPNYWRGDTENFYAAGNATECFSCKNKFQHLLCPHCNEPKFYKGCEYTCGVKQSCDHCKKQFQHVLCTSCYYPNYYSDCSFKYATQTTCHNKNCNEIFELVICPDCGKENFCKGAANTTSNNILKGYRCHGCQSKFSHIPCTTCHESVYLNYEQDFNNGINSFSCPSCKNKLKNLYKCEACKRISMDSNQCKICIPAVQPNIPSGFLGSNRPLHSDSIRMFPPPNFQQNGNPQQILGSNQQNTGPIFSSLIRNVNQTHIPIQPNTTNQRPGGLFQTLLSGPTPNTQAPLFPQNWNMFSSGNPIPTNNSLNTDLSPMNQLKASISSKDTQSQQPSTTVPNPSNSQSGMTTSGVDDKKCTICIDEIATIAFIPCGHKKTCKQCSDTLIKNKQKCPICRQAIKEAIRIFE